MHIYSLYVDSGLTYNISILVNSCKFTVENYHPPWLELISGTENPVYKAIHTSLVQISMRNSEDNFKNRNQEKLFV